MLCRGTFCQCSFYSSTSDARVIAIKIGDYVLMCNSQSSNCDCLKNVIINMPTFLSAGQPLSASSALLWGASIACAKQYRLLRSVCRHHVHHWRHPCIWAQSRSSRKWLPHCSELLCSRCAHEWGSEYTCSVRSVCGHVTISRHKGIFSLSMLPQMPERSEVALNRSTGTCWARRAAILSASSAAFALSHQVVIVSIWLSLVTAKACQQQAAFAFQAAACGVAWQPAVCT